MFNGPAALMPIFNILSVIKDETLPSFLFPTENGAGIYLKTAYITQEYDNVLTNLLLVADEALKEYG